MSDGFLHVLFGAPGTGKSIPGNTKIVIKSDDTIERIEIGKLVDNRDTNKTYQALTLDRNLKIVWSRIDKYIRHDSPIELFRICTDSGREILCTKDHNFMVLKDGELVAIRSIELRAGDYIPYVKRFDAIPTNADIIYTLDRDFGYFCGAYLSEGDINKDRSVRITNSNDEMHKQLHRFVSRLSSKHQIYVDQRTGTKCTVVSNRKLCDFITDNFGRYSDGKKIPDWALQDNIEFIGGLLSGYFDGDGTVGENEITVVSKSLELIRGISILLARFDIRTSFSKTFKIATNSLTHHGDYYNNLYIHASEIDKFRDNIGFIIKSKKEKLDIITSTANEYCTDMIPIGTLFDDVMSEHDGLGRLWTKCARRDSARGMVSRRLLGKYISELSPQNRYYSKLMKMYNSDVSWTEITSVSEVGYEGKYVYDISVGNTETFVTDDLLVLHNTEALADIVVNVELTRGVALSDCLVSSFTVDASNEIIQRIMTKLGIQDPEKIKEIKQKMWMGTIHSICFSFMRESGLKVKNVMGPIDFKVWAEKCGLEHKYDFGRTKLVTQQTILKYGMIEPQDTQAGVVLQAIEWVKHTHHDIILKKLFQDFQEFIYDAPILQESTVKLDESRLPEYWWEYEKYKDNTGKIDYCDMLLYAYERKFCPPTRVMFIDEFHDLSPLKYDIYKMWKAGHERTYICGDDDQCIPEGSLVNTPNGMVPIEQIKEGDLVVSSCGTAGLITMPVLGIKRNTGRFKIRKFKIRNGTEVVTTLNHKMFCRIPETNWERGEKGDYWFVYLMNTRGKWRVGMTNDPRMRVRFERGTDKYVLLRSFEDKKDARLFEELCSLKYGIPKGTISRLGRDTYFEDEDFVNELYSCLDVDNSVMVLTEKSGIDLRYPQFVQSAVVRGSVTRVVCNISMCAEHECIRHVLSISTHDTNTIKKLESVGLKFRQHGKEMVLVVYRSSLNELQEIVGLIKSALPDIQVVTRMTIAKGIDGRWLRATVVPASNVLPGMMIPIIDNGEPIYQVVESIDDTEIDTTVYDLEVERTHNFAVNNVLVHNSIFAFIAANPKFLLTERDVADRVTILPHSFRLPSLILHVCTRYIRREVRPEMREDKYIEPRAQGGIVRVMKMRNLSQLINDTMIGTGFILCRTNYHVKEITKQLLSNQVYTTPYTYIRPDAMSFFNKDFVNLTNAIIKYEDERPLSYDEFYALTSKLEIGVFKPGMITEFVKRPKNEYTFETIVKMFMEPMLVEEVIHNLKLADLESFQIRKRHLQKKEIEMPVKLRIGTIHSSKGLQADTVYLINNITRRIQRAMSQSKDKYEDEARVWYVGMSRAKERLFIMDDFFGTKKTFSI